MFKKLQNKMKSGGLWARLAAFAVVLMMTTANGKLTAQTVAEDPSSTYSPTNITNGGFDSRPFEAYKYNGVVYNTHPGKGDEQQITESYPNAVGGGWNTTENTVIWGGLFEWTNEYSTYGLSTSNGYFIEMNAINSAVLYQDLKTQGGDVIRWTLQHAARNAGDNPQKMRVEVGSPEMNGNNIQPATGTGDNINSHIMGNTLATYRYDGITNPSGVTLGYASTKDLAYLAVNMYAGWNPACGVYVVPEGQSVSRFAFVSESISPGLGNLLDDLTFSTLIGNLKAVANNDGSATFTGYWGDADATKKLVVKIGETTSQLTMSDVLEKNFTVTIPAATIGGATTIEVYHQDYEQAKRTVAITDHWHCICGDGECTAPGHVHQVVGWKRWESTNSLPNEAGYWYLANDVTLTSTYTPVDGVNLCLNGHVVKNGSGDNCNKLVNISGVTFTLTDCTDTPHYFNKTIPNELRPEVWVYSLTTSPTSSSICVNGGCITGGYGWWGSPNHSPCLNVESGGTFNFYRGNLVGNSSEQQSAGMAVRSGATLNMYGGNVEGNYSAWGYSRLEGTANIYSGSFKNNGNWDYGLYCDGTTTIYDIEVSGNVSPNGIAGLYAGGNFMMLGGTVTGNLTTAGNGGLEVDTDNAVIGGDVRITGNYSHASRTGFDYSGGIINNLYLNNKTITVSSTTPLINGAHIGVTTATAPTEGNPVAVTTNCASSDLQYFKSDNTAYTTIYDDSKVKLAVIGSNVCQIVETGVMYGTVAAAINAATTGQTVQLLVDRTENVTIASDKTITLDLNGFVLNQSTNNNGVIVSSGNLTIKDSDASKTHYFTYISNGAWTYLPDHQPAATDVPLADIGTATLVSDETVISVPGGCITGGKATGYGGGVRINSGSVTLQSGNIIGNSIYKDSGDYQKGGGVCVYGGTFYMQGGVIAGNSAYTGGGVQTNNYTTLNMTGGKIISNYGGLGGGVNNDGTIIMTGGEIAYNTGYHGGGGVRDCGYNTVGGTARIVNNTSDGVNANNFLMCSGKITVSSATPLINGANIGVTAGTPTAGNPVEVTTANTTDYSEYFTSDNAAYYIANGADNKVILKVAETLPETLTTGTYPGIYTIPNTTTIPDGVTVTLTGDIINSTPENFIIEDGGQLITGTEGINATVKKNISEPIEWYTISSPIKGEVTTSTVENLLTDPYDLYRYDEPAHYWINAKNSESGWSNITPGRGYLYAGDQSSDRALGFKGEIAVGDVYQNISSSATTLKGFNLLGNPYTHNITLDNIELNSGSLAGYYILNNGTWAARTTEAIAPCTGILVQVPAAATATFSNNAGTSKSNSDMYGIAISVSNSSYEDRAYAMFGDSYGLEKMGHISDEAPMLYINQYGTDYAIAMMDNNVETFDLYFEAQVEGSYTITMKNNGSFGHLHLIDRLTGIDTDMLGGSYTFNGSPSDASDRFTVVLSENANVSVSDSFVYQSGSELIINGEGTLQIIDMLGRVVMNKQVRHERVSVSGFNTGAYIVRLIGNEVRTEKIILK